MKLVDLELELLLFRVVCTFSWIALNWFYSTENHLTTNLTIWYGFFSIEIELNRIEHWTMANYFENLFILPYTISKSFFFWNEMEFTWITFPKRMEWESGRNSKSISLQSNVCFKPIRLFITVGHALNWRKSYSFKWIAIIVKQLRKSA